MAKTDLLSAFLRTDYHVRDRTFDFTLRVDQPSPDLDRCHAAHGVTSSAFITAFNPRSQLRALADNQAAQSALEAQLTAAGLVFLRGMGLSPDGDWPGEQSVLVLGLDATAACAIGRACGQHAILLAESGLPVRLVWCDEPAH